MNSSDVQLRRSVFTRAGRHLFDGEIGIGVARNAIAAQSVPINRAARFTRKVFNRRGTCDPTPYLLRQGTTAEITGMAEKSTDGLDREQIWSDFQESVNMSPGEIEDWLATDDSKAVGWKDESGKESTGHESGRRIVAIKQKRKEELTADDYRHMRKVVGYVHRHLAQGGPDNDKKHSRWRYSLMNWGHDPLRA